MKEVNVLGMLCIKLGLIKKSLCIYFIISLLSSCVVLKKEREKKTNVILNEKQQQIDYSKTDIFLNKYINKKTKLLYKDLGEPMEKKAEIDDENKIINIEFVYKYIYNFKQKKYDCHISFFIDKDSQKIKYFSKSSKKCDYIFFKKQ